MPKTPTFIRESHDDYHAKRRHYLTSHQLIDFAACPLKYKQKLAGLIGEVSRETYLTGRASHTLTLEGRKEFEATYITGGPINPATQKPYGSDTKKFSEWAAQQDRVVITEAQYSVCCAIDYSIRQHDEASWLIREGIPEAVLRAKYCGVQCQVRLDWWNPEEGIVDLKTCGDLDLFEADCETYRYWEQLAFYRSIVQVACGEFFPVHLIAAEKQEPFRVGVWKLDADDLDTVERKNYRQVQQLIGCRETDTWPTGYEQKRLLKRTA